MDFDNDICLSRLLEVTSVMAVKDQRESDSNASFVLDIITFSVWIHPFRSELVYQIEIYIVYRRIRANLQK